MRLSLDLVSLLENCLARMNAGEDLEMVLKQYPQQADELRPLLIAARKARQSGLPLRIPASAQIDSRTRFLLEAQHHQTRPKAFLPRFSFAGVMAAIVILVITGVFGTTLASANAIPGQTFYPVKLAVEQAQLALTTDQTARLDLQEKFDQRRIVEAEELEQQGRTQAVTVAGPLEETIDHAWRVGGVKLNLTEDQIALASSLDGSYIEVTGEIRGGEGINVKSMGLRTYSFSGTIQSIQGNQWVVNGVKVLVSETTIIKGKAAVGKRVELVTLRSDQGIFTALKVEVSGKSNSAGNDQNNNGSQDQPGGDDESKQSGSQETPEPRVTEPTKVREDSRTPEPTGEFHPSATPQPTEVHEPTHTPD